MSQTAQTLTREEAVACFRRLQAELAEATKDLSEEGREALADRITQEVNAALRARVRESRGESE